MHRRGHQEQGRRRLAVGGQHLGAARRHEAAERETRQPQGGARVLFAEPAVHGDQVFHFADAVAVGALAFADATEVEAQGGGARVPGGADQGGHHLVIHGAAELGMRVADDGDHGRVLRFPFEHRFQGAFRTLQGQPVTTHGFLPIQFPGRFSWRGN